jgi:hypothetical protein
MSGRIAVRPDVYGRRVDGKARRASLRGRTVEQGVRLPDGRSAVVRVGVADDPYIARKEMETVALELRVEDAVVGVLNTILTLDQESEAVRLVREIASRLESGEIEPTAGALEPYATEIPAT